MQRAEKQDFVKHFNTALKEKEFLLVAHYKGLTVSEISSLRKKVKSSNTIFKVEKNTLAPKAASVIHTDFEKNFIRAEAVTCEDFIKFGSAEKCKENGKLRIEGKDYIVKDGDVLYFRVNP